jgi:hypothetical protein
MGMKTTTLSMQLILGEERREGTPAASRERGTGERELEHDNIG